MNKKIYWVFVFAFLISDQSFAGTFFDQILGDIRGNKLILDRNFGNRNIQGLTQIKVLDTGNKKSVTVQQNNQNVGSIGIDTKSGNINIKTPSGQINANLTQPQTYLNKVLSSVGIQLPTNANTNQNTQPTSNPFLNSNIVSQTPLGNAITNPAFANQVNSSMGGASQMFGNQGLGGMIQKIFSGNPQSAVAGLQSSPIFKHVMQQVTPYNGPGGSIPGDCGIPRGPIAFNIGAENGNGVQCDAKTVFVGFKQNLPSGKFGGGYVNPMLEKGKTASGASVENCANPQTANEYGEKCFANYTSGEGQSYMQAQLLHWQEEGQKVGQKCVPIYVDNCDSIGSQNYKSILDSIEQLNNSGQVKLKVINPNPQNSGCNFLSHPAVIGALAELDEKNGPETARQVANLRNKPEQLLIVTRGGKGTDANLREASRENILNASFSFDVTVNGAKEYQKIYNCTYHP